MYLIHRLIVEYHSHVNYKCVDQPRPSLATVFFNFAAVCGVSLFTWGRNANFTLGHNLSRNVPERLETEPSMGNIVQVFN